MKKIGIDLRALQVGHEFRGIGANVRSLLEAMLLEPDFTKNELYFYFYDTTNPLELLRLPEGLKYRTVIIKNKKDPRKNKTKLQKAAAYAKEVASNHLAWSPIPNASKLDIFIQFDQALGLPRTPLVKKVLLVYDLIPLAFRDAYLPRIAPLYRKHGWRAALKTFGFNTRYLVGLKTIKRADLVMAISQHTAKDIQEYLGINKKKIVIVPCALRTPAPTEPVDLKSRQKQDKISDKQKTISMIISEADKVPYILYVGGVETPRRRLDDLVAAYHQIRASGRRIRLVLVGKELGSIKSIPHNGTAEQLSHLSYSEDLFMLGFVSDSDVDRLYDHAAAFTFISLYEGWGLPILEAYSKGCPVITYSTSSIPEVAGDAAIMCEPTRDSLVKAIEKVLDKNSGLPTREQMRKQLAKFSWRNSATIAVRSILEK